VTQIADQSARQTFWREWLGSHLPPELEQRLCGAVERAGILTIFAESAAWAARLRYVVRELEAEIRAVSPEVDQVNVRVLPRAGK
jgi:hypothetical protein